MNTPLSGLAVLSWLLTTPVAESGPLALLLASTGALAALTLWPRLRLAPVPAEARRGERR